MGRMSLHIIFFKETAKKEFFKDDYFWSWEKGDFGETENIYLYSLMKSHR